MNKTIKFKDKKFIWHPFTKTSKSYDPIVVSSAVNEKIFDIDGNEYIDLIASWWVNIHGHCKKEILTVINKQLKKFEQVLFADFTHQPAVELAEKLSEITPNKLNRTFYSDNGSTAVEIAMKVAVQYWYNSGVKKNKFVAMQGGYHGDTLGAMSVGFTSGFYQPFKEIIPNNFFFSFPENWEGKNDIEKDEEQSLKEIDDLLSENLEQIAAVVIEPLIQGASGMRICRKEYLNKAMQKFRDAGVIIIFDEVMTGFGRTGKMFACDHLKVKPDILCLAKSLTGGYLPLAATIFDEKIHRNFFGDDISKSFMHGHSFTANPVACATALCSIKLFDKENSLKKVKKISEIHRENLKILKKKINISKTRLIGSISAFNVNDIKDSYGSNETELLKKKFLKEGLLIRPLGNTIYLMPPYCITEKNLNESYYKILNILKC